MVFELVFHSLYLIADAKNYIFTFPFIIYSYLMVIFQKKFRKVDSAVIISKKKFWRESSFLWRDSNDKPPACRSLGRLSSTELLVNNNFVQPDRFDVRDEASPCTEAETSRPTIKPPKGH